MKSINSKNSEQTNNKQIKNFKTLKIITAILLIVATAYSSWIMADIITDAQTNGWAGLGIIAWIVVAAIALAVPLVVALVGLIMSIVKKARAECSAGTLIYFIVFTALPFVVFFGSIGVFDLFF